MADAGDSKSPAGHPACGFDSLLWHQPSLTRAFTKREPRLGEPGEGCPAEAREASEGGLRVHPMTRRPFATALLVLTAITLSHAQTGPRFEVTSVKPVIDSIDKTPTEH